MRTIHKEGTRLKRVPALSAKARYSSGATKTLAAYQRRFDAVRSAVKRAISEGKLPGDGRLERAQEAIARNLAEASAVLTELRKSEVTEWESRRAVLERTWDDISQSMSIVVARIKEQ